MLKNKEEYKIDTIVEEEYLIKFLLEIENDFKPKISEKLNITNYAKKLIEYANFYVIKSEFNIIGLIAFYCNNIEEKTAHIPLAGINYSFRRFSFGSMLLKLSIDKIKKMGFESISLETWEGGQAQSFYQKHGFEIVSSKKDEIYNINIITMELKLN